MAKRTRKVENFGDGIITLRGSMWRGKEPEIALVKGGKRAFIWVGHAENGKENCVGIISGPSLLRQFAKAILEQVGEE